MKVSDLLDQREYPAVWKFLETQVEMQFADLRVLLQLPLGSPNAPGCNFATAAVLLNLLSGFSVCLFDTSVESLKSRTGRGDRLKRLLTRYYPWDGEQFSPTKGSEWLYDVIRNPMAHSLGVQVTSEDKWVGIWKRSLSLVEVKRLEDDSQRPIWVDQEVLGLTVFKRPVSGGQICEFLSVPCLYWGVWRLLDRLCKDPTQMKKAEELLEQLGFEDV